MVQILAGLITYLLLAIHCHKNHDEPVSIKRVRELRLQIQNEFRASEALINIKNFQRTKTTTNTCKYLTGRYWTELCPETGFTSSAKNTG